MTTDEVKQGLEQAVRDHQAGDRSAFDRIFTLTGDAVFRICCNVTGNHHTAEDVMQEVYMSVYKALNTFRGESSFFTWLYRIALNKSLSAVGRKREQVLDDTILPDIPAPERPDDGLQQADLALLRECIRELPEDFRGVVALRDIEGLSYEEVAAIEAVPVGTIRSRLNRARGLLKEAFFRKRESV